MSINKRFKEIRFDKDLSQKEYAEAISLKTRQVTEIERGNQKVSIDIAIKVEDEFNINLRWLLTGRGEKYLNSDANSVNVNNQNGNVAVNGTITINTKDYADSNEIKELLELLKDVPKSWVDKIIVKLKKSLEAIDKEF